MLAALLAVTTNLGMALPPGTEVLGIHRSADGSRLTIDLIRQRSVTCYDSDGPSAADCRVIRGRLCCGTGGWLPPPYNKVEEAVPIRYVIDCCSRRFDQRGDGRGWQPLEADQAVRAVAEAHCLFTRGCS